MPCAAWLRVAGCCQTTRPFAGSSANSLSEPALEPYAKNLPPRAATAETGWTAEFVHDGAPMAKPPGTGLGAVGVRAETVDGVAVARVVLGGAVLLRFRGPPLVASKLRGV